jgi:class 3 adenylate cyclase
VVRIGLRCGIDGGYVLVGLTGTEMRDHFTAFGLEVNRANRVEGEAWRSSTGVLMVSHLVSGVRKLVRDEPILFGREHALEGMKSYGAAPVYAHEVR